MQDYPFDVDREGREDGGDKQPSFWSALNKSQKISVVVLIVFATLMIVVWAVEFKRGLTEPFAYKEENQPAVGTSAGGQDASTEALKTKDTDGDSLSDWDELNIYKTSPYLEDSDSDGLKDGAETKSGTDPNCPEGRVCYGAGGNIENPSGSASSSSSVNQLATTSQPALNSVNLSEAELKKLLDGSLDAAGLRKILLDSGMDKKILDQFSDEELIKNYKGNSKAR